MGGYKRTTDAIKTSMRDIGACRRVFGEGVKDAHITSRLFRT
jgi:hypothetical protein